MNTTCWKLFSYLVIDCKAAQDRLNQMAADGWALEHIYLGLFARFCRTNRTDLTYFLDWSSPRFQEAGEYLQLCSDADWEPVQTLDYLNIYASRSGSFPSPIQTDPTLEYQRFQQKVLRQMALGAAILAGMFLLLFLARGGPYRIGGWSWRETAAILLSTSFSTTFALLCAPFWLAGWLAYLVLLLRRILAWRAAAREGRPLPSPDPKTAQTWGTMRFLGNFSLVALLFLLLPDALFNGFGTSSSTIGLLIGNTIALFICWENPRLARRSLLFVGWSAALLLCLRLNGPLRAEYPGRLPPAPLIEQAQVLGEDRNDAVWGSRAKWQELLPGPEMEYSDIGYHASLSVEVQTWTSPSLAQWAFGPVPEDMEAVPGHPGVWRGTSGRDGEGIYLLRLNKTQMTLRYFGAFPQDPLEPALVWLEET